MAGDTLVNEKHQGSICAPNYMSGMLAIAARRLAGRVASLQAFVTSGKGVSL
jgi:hypothetical protein